MLVDDLVNIFLRLEMAAKGDSSEFVFDAGIDGQSPFVITGVHLDAEGDVCLECDVRKLDQALSASELAHELEQFDGAKIVYFVTIDANGEEDLYDIKDGGTKDRWSSDLRLIPIADLQVALEQFPQDAVPYFESGTINFTINSIYTDSQGCLVLESNEIEELDNYTVGLILDEFQHFDQSTQVYLYEDESREFYGIHPDELRTDSSGNPWIKVR